MLKTPILLITFNRPNHVRQVLTEIRKQQPNQLFVCQDGARDDNPIDAERVGQVRQVGHVNCIHSTKIRISVVVLGLQLVLRGSLSM